MCMEERNIDDLQFTTPTKTRLFRLYLLHRQHPFHERYPALLLLLSRYSCGPPPPPHPLLAAAAIVAAVGLGMRRIYLKDSVAPGTQRRLAIFSSHSFQLMLAIIFVSARDNSSPAFLLLLLFYCHQSIPDSLEAGSSYLSLVGMCETDFYESSRVLVRHHTITVRVRTSKSSSYDDKEKPCAPGENTTVQSR